MLGKRSLKYGDNEKEIYDCSIGMVTNERVICILEKRASIISIICPEGKTLKAVTEKIPIEEIDEAKYDVRKSFVLGILLIFVGTLVGFSIIGLPLTLLSFYGGYCMIRGNPRAIITTSKERKTSRPSYPWKKEEIKNFVLCINNQLDSKNN